MTWLDFRDMADETLKWDANKRQVAGAVTNDGSLEIRQLRVDSATGRLLVDSNGGGGATTDVTVRDATVAAQKLAVDANGRIGVNNFPASQAVTGPLTDAQLRNTAVPVTIPTPVPVTDNAGSLTVDGTVSVSNMVPAVETGLAKEVTLASILTELGQKYEGGAIALDAATLAALETISVANFPAVQPVSDNGASLTVDGTVAVSNFPATQPVSGTVTANPTRPATSAVTVVTASATSVTLLAANANRLGATIYNDSTSSLRVKFGTTASTTSFTILMAAASYFEVPFDYTGRIDGIWTAAVGDAKVTELTA